MTSTDTDHAAVLGAGMLGSATARALLSRGIETTVWNRTPGRTDELAGLGAIVAETARQAVLEASIVLCVMPDYAAARMVLEPLADVLHGRTVVNLTSGTPEEARGMADWSRSREIGYLDGAAMSGTRLVGDPTALFLFAGSADTYAASEATLNALGNAMYLGDDPGAAALYDGALFGVAWGLLAAFYHGAAILPGAEKRLADVVAGHLPFLAGLIRDHAGQITDGTFPDHDGSVRVHAAAMEHLISTSQVAGVPIDVPALPLDLMQRAIASGDGDAGIASVARVLRAPVNA